MVHPAGLQPPPRRVVRKQAEVGRRHAREKLRVDVTVGYNVDSFGHTAALPRLLREGGYDSYVMMRPMAHERILPAALFRWRTPGDDGPGILTWRLPLAYCTPSEDLTKQVRGGDRVRRARRPTT